jgi:hypothetical protein
VLNHSPCSFDLWQVGIENRLSSPPILKLAMLHCPRWLAGETMLNVLAVGAPAVITANCHPAEQGRMPPCLAGHRRRLGESLLCADACLGLLLCRDTEGLRLLRIRRPLSCMGTSLPGRGSWIAVRVPSSHGRKGWRPLRACLGRCVRNVMLVALVPMPSSRTSSPRCTPPVLSPNSSPILLGHWRNARFFSACRRWTWRCGR